MSNLSAGVSANGEPLFKPEVFPTFIKSISIIAFYANFNNARPDQSVVVDWYELLLGGNITKASDPDTSVVMGGGGVSINLAKLTIPAAPTPDLIRLFGGGIVTIPGGMVLPKGTDLILSAAYNGPAPVCYGSITTGYHYEKA